MDPRFEIERSAGGKTRTACSSEITMISANTLLVRSAKWRKIFHFVHFVWPESHGVSVGKPQSPTGLSTSFGEKRLSFVTENGTPATRPNPLLSTSFGEILFSNRRIRSLGLLDALRRQDGSAPRGRWLRLGLFSSFGTESGSPVYQPSAINHPPRVLRSWYSEGGSTPPTLPPCNVSDLLPR